MVSGGGFEGILRAHIVPQEICCCQSFVARGSQGLDTNLNPTRLTGGLSKVLWTYGLSYGGSPAGTIVSKIDQDGHLDNRLGPLSGDYSLTIPG
jgi:hypothetical protein